jgi:hypothetical protein
VLCNYATDLFVFKTIYKTLNIHTPSLIIIIIFINCNWVVTRWQWSFNTYTKHEIVRTVHIRRSRNGQRGPGSSVGIATGYGMDGPGIESRWRARFYAPVQTGPGAHPASCTMGTGSFPGVESGRGVTLTPHPSLVPRSKKRVELYLYSPQGPSWPVERVKTYLEVTNNMHWFYHSFIL